MRGFLLRSISGRCHIFFFSLGRSFPIQRDVMSVCISYIMNISPITFQRHGVAAWTLRNRLLSCISFSWRTAISLPTNKWFISTDRMYRACLHGLRFLTTVSLVLARHYELTYGFFRTIAVITLREKEIKRGNEFYGEKTVAPFKRRS